MVIHGHKYFKRSNLFNIKWIRKVFNIFEIQKRIDWTKYFDDTVVIHLERRTDRLDLINKIASSRKLKGNKTILSHIRFFNAVDGLLGETHPPEIVQPWYDFKFHWTIDPNPWQRHHLKENKTQKTSVAENAISMSHYKIWKEIAEGDKERVLILEDDFDFRPGFQSTIYDIFEKELPKDCDLLYMSTLPGHSGFTYENYSNNLMRLYNGVWWLSGYMLTKKGAQILLDNLPIVGPVDVWINYVFKDLKVYMTKENLILQADDTKSDNTYSFVETFGN